MKALSFDKVDHLCYNTLFHGNNGQFIGVFAVTHDGDKVPFFKVTRKHLDLLFELLPELAKKWDICLLLTDNSRFPQL